uniref:HATPase_c domain-containing protein n=1 Tax=Parastrongyloides trichosuri TaxID=131310 RepID=A0A0N4ZDF5_PARTI
MVRRISSSRPITGSSLPTGFEAVLGARAVSGLALADFGHGIVQLLGRDAGGFQRLGSGPAFLGDGGQQAFGSDEGVAGLLGRVLGGAEDARQIAVEVKLARAAFDLRPLLQQALDRRAPQAAPSAGARAPIAGGGGPGPATGRIGRPVWRGRNRGRDSWRSGSPQEADLNSMRPYLKRRLELSQRRWVWPIRHARAQTRTPAAKGATGVRRSPATGLSRRSGRSRSRTARAGGAARRRTSSGPGRRRAGSGPGRGARGTGACHRRWPDRSSGPGASATWPRSYRSPAAPGPGCPSAGSADRHRPQTDSAATAAAAGCAANSCRAGSGSRSADTAGGRSDRRGNSPETRARRWSRPRPRCRPVPAASRTGRTASRRRDAHRWRKARGRGQGVLGRSAPDLIVLIRPGEVQLIARAQLGALAHRPGVGAGEADGLLRGQAVLGLIYRRLRRYAEDVGGQGVVLLIVAIIAQLVRPFVPGRIELVQNPSGDAPALHGEAARAVAAIGARQGARGVARLEQAAHIAVDVEAIGARLASQHGFFRQPVFGGDAAEDAILDRFNILGGGRRADHRAGRVKLFAQAVEGQALLVVTIAEIAGQGQLALLARAARADVPASVIAHIGAQRSSGDGARRPRGGGGGDRRRTRLGDQIDDPARALGAVGGRRIGHHLDAGVAIGRQLQHRIGAVRSRQEGRGAAVHQQGDIAIAAQGDVALRIDIDRGHIAQGLGQGAGRRLKIVGQAVTDGVDRSPHVIGAGADDDVTHGGGLIVLVRLLRRSLNGTGRRRLHDRQPADSRDNNQVGAGNRHRHRTVGRQHRRGGERRLHQCLRQCAKGRVRPDPDPDGRSGAQPGLRAGRAGASAVPDPGRAARGVEPARLHRLPVGRQGDVRRRPLRRAGLGHGDQHPRPDARRRRRLPRRAIRALAGDPRLLGRRDPGRSARPGRRSLRRLARRRPDPGRHRQGGSGPGPARRRHRPAWRRSGRRGRRHPRDQPHRRRLLPADAGQHPAGRRLLVTSEPGDPHQARPVLRRPLPGDRRRRVQVHRRPASEIPQRRGHPPEPTEPRQRDAEVGDLLLPTQWGGGPRSGGGARPQRNQGAPPSRPLRRRSPPQDKGRRSRRQTHHLGDAQVLAQAVGDGAVVLGRHRLAQGRLVGALLGADRRHEGVGRRGVDTAATGRLGDGHAQHPAASVQHRRARQARQRAL